jgi:hypothetical protein
MLKLPGITKLPLHPHLYGIAKRIPVLMLNLEEVIGPCVLADMCLRFTALLESPTFVVLQLSEA